MENLIKVSGNISKTALLQSLSVCSGTTITSRESHANYISDSVIPRNDWTAISDQDFEDIFSESTDHFDTVSKIALESPISPSWAPLFAVSFFTLT